MSLFTAIKPYCSVMAMARIPIEMFYYFMSSNVHMHCNCLTKFPSRINQPLSTTLSNIDLPWYGCTLAKHRTYDRCIYSYMPCLCRSFTLLAGGGNVSSSCMHTSVIRHPNEWCRFISNLIMYQEVALAHTQDDNS